MLDAYLCPQLPGKKQEHKQMCEGCWEISELLPCYGEIMNDDKQGQGLESLQDMLRTANDSVWL